MFAEVVAKKRPFGMAASEEETEALTGLLDVARGLENLPVSAWPPGARPAPFQVGAGLDGRERAEAGAGLDGLELRAGAGLHGLELRAGADLGGRESWWQGRSQTAERVEGRGGARQLRELRAKAGLHG